MKILVTGGAGFIGRHLARLHADRGDRVLILDNLAKDGGKMDPEVRELLGRPRVRFLRVDLTRPVSKRLPAGRWDVVYHLAAINGTRLFYEIPYDLARANLLMTLNLLNWLEIRRPGQLVYTSTSEVYAGAGTFGLLKIPTAENAPVVFPQPTSVRFSYGTSKFMGEFLCLQFGKKAGVPVKVVRYHNVYGPNMGDKHVIPEFFARLSSGERPFRIFGGGETRAFCYVSDAVEATRRVAQRRGLAGGIVHIGNPNEEITIGSLARLMMKMTGTSLPVRELGSRESSVSRRCPDIGKLRRATGFRPRVSLRQGLELILRWNQDRKNARRVKNLGRKT